MNISSPVLADAATAPMPRAPQTIAETGLPSGFLLDHLIKTVFRQGMERPSTMASALRLSTLVVHELIEMAKEKQLLSLLGQPGANMAASASASLASAACSAPSCVLVNELISGRIPKKINKIDPIKKARELIIVPICSVSLSTKVGCGRASAPI